MDKWDYITYCVELRPEMWAKLWMNQCFSGLSNLNRAQDLRRRLPQSGQGRGPAYETASLQIKVLKEDGLSAMKTAPEGTPH